ncbi:MAG: LysR family transcriptional regulator [Chloroflexi bacterium AL-W]|nr:LysR family transcriptional regulator [Chloroflexi bacterium AL-N1]NOK68721.1 LysR family transcriptional regulator [Chloroflexi bacterium AL-N10]NOK76207.1 LysR family transcriptional regulator [Chloroflexi bacterium AL-N5]NOK84156.1 LysR family transcriptional regulator [Chloroflexi bacterium AL-W]NOK91345.1 LysR family transcriptional regulator [Chloroflexi bacterium AL-N15]
MELRHLIYFEAVARYQHVSRAAEDLAIAQPALSKQIHDLERELGVALFKRVGRNVRLTEAGQALLIHVRTILSQIDILRAEMRERVGLQRGRVTVGVPPTVGTRLLPRVLALFHQQYPGLELCMSEGGTQTILKLLEEGNLDLGVVSLPIESTNFEVTPLFSEDVVLVVSHDHRLASEKSVMLSDLAEEAFLIYPPGYEMRDVTLSSCRRAGFHPRVVLDGGEMDMILRVAEAGLGIALVPRLALYHSVRLAILSVTDQDLQRTLALVSPAQHLMSPAARTLRGFLASELVDAAQEVI